VADGHESGEEGLGGGCPGGGAGDGSDAEQLADTDDAEIEEMKRRVAELEDLARTKAEEGAEEGAVAVARVTTVVPSGVNVDVRSVYVSNVDFAAQPEELQDYFQACGTVDRVTILCDHATGRPRGFAYVEFKEAEGATNARLLDGTEFKARPIRVVPKRATVPGMRSRGRARGRGGGGGSARGAIRARGRGGPLPHGGQAYAHAPFFGASPYYLPHPHYYAPPYCYASPYCYAPPHCGAPPYPNQCVVFAPH
jgi:polyadenylate-binding protein 2